MYHGFYKFQTISPGVGRIKAPKAFQWLIPNASRIGRLQDRKNSFYVRHGESRMRFGRGPETFLDADMQLTGTYFEPAAAPCAQSFGLFDLFQSQKAAEELACGHLATGGSRELYVVDIMHQHAPIIATYGFEMLLSGRRKVFLARSEASVSPR